MAMTGQKIEMLGNRLLPRVWKMHRADVEDEYTLLIYKELIFKQDLPNRIFSFSSLKNPGR